MRKFVIISDSCCDLDKSLRERFDVEYIPMHISFKGKDMKADLDWNEVSVQEYYQAMREGNRVTTAQITANEYREAFEKHLQAGCDVLSISCSSAFSKSVETSYAVRDELKAKYPEAKIICVDSLIAVAGLGMLCIRASELRAEGKTIEETAAWIEENKLKVNQECTPDKLTWLKQAGRVSAASAFFGGLLNVKPIIISDASGMNVAVEKVKGRQTALKRLIERFKEEYESVPYQRIFISHADCLEEALQFKEMVIEALPDKDVEMHLVNFGPIIGATVGPGMIALFFHGKEVTYDSRVKN